MTTRWTWKEKLDSMVVSVQEKFREHPIENGQSYTKHLLDSMYFGMCSFVCFVVFVLHGLFPFLFQQHGWNMVQHLEKQIRDVHNNIVTNVSEDDDDPPKNTDELNEPRHVSETNTESEDDEDFNGTVGDNEDDKEN